MTNFGSKSTFAKMTIFLDPNQIARNDNIGASFILYLFKDCFGEKIQ